MNEYKETNYKKDEWIHVLWKWASDNLIPNSVIPRNKDRLLEITKLSIGLHPGVGYSNNGVIDCNTYIKYIPKEIGHLTNLTELDIRSWEHGDFPQELYNLTNLTRLCIGKGPMKEISSDIGKLKKLTFLAFSGNEIKKTSY